MKTSVIKPDHTYVFKNGVLRRPSQIVEDIVFYDRVDDLGQTISTGQSKLQSFAATALAPLVSL